MIVADSGPIIVFARIGHLDLLQQVVSELVIPDAVYEDLVIKGKGRAGAAYFHLISTPANGRPLSSPNSSGHSSLLTRDAAEIQPWNGGSKFSAASGSLPRQSEGALSTQ